MSKKTIEVDVKKIKNLLTSLRNCCDEALDGTWDHTTSEGEEGFEAMISDIEEISSELDIELPPYYKNDEEETA